MLVQNTLQKFLKDNNANKLSDKELERLMKKLNIKVKFDTDTILFMYNDFADFSNEIVKVCRGIILYRETFDIACYPFDKFNNYTSTLADTIDWKSAVVQEKIDGQIIKVWFNKLKKTWMASSNSSIYLNDKLNKLFNRAAEKIDYTKLDKNKTYIFELVSPLNSIIIKYENTEIYHIGTRDNITQKEENINIGIKKPKIYSIKSLNEAIDTINKMCKPGERYEGFVVVDKNYTRLKVKSQYYFDCKHVTGRLSNGKDSALRFIDSCDINEIINKVPELEQMIRYYDKELKRAYEEVTMLVAMCRDIRNNTYRKIDYIEEIDKLKIKNKKLRNKLVSYFDSHKSIKEYVDSMDKKVIYDSIKMWRE